MTSKDDFLMTFSRIVHVNGFCVPRLLGYANNYSAITFKQKIVRIEKNLEKKLYQPDSKANPSIGNLFV